MTSKLAATSNSLSSLNPNRPLGLAKMITAVALFCVAMAYTSDAIAWVRTLVSLAGVKGFFASRAWYLAYLSIFALTVAMASLSAIRLGWRGFIHISYFAVPLGAPKDLQAKAGMDDLLVHRTLVAFENPSKLLLRAAALFSDRMKFLTAQPAAYVEETVTLVSSWGLRLALILLAVWILPPLLSQYDVRVIVSTPLPLVVVVLGLLATRVIATLLLTNSVPTLDVHEESLHIINSGNPQNLYHFIENKFGQMRVEKFQNRVYERKEPMAGVINPGETGVFRGQLTVETQPRPLKSKFNAAGLALSVGGGLLLALGYFILLGMLRQAVLEMAMSQQTVDK